MEKRSHSAPAARSAPDDGFWRLVRELPATQRADILHRYTAALAHAELASGFHYSEETARRGLADVLTNLQFETG